MLDDEEVLRTPMVQREIKRNEKLNKALHLSKQRKRQRLFQINHQNQTSDQQSRIIIEQQVDDNDDGIDVDQDDNEKMNDDRLQTSSSNDNLSVTTPTTTTTTLKKENNNIKDINNSCNKMTDEFSSNFLINLENTNDNNGKVMINGQGSSSSLTSEQQQQISETDKFLSGDNLVDFYSVCRFYILLSIMLSFIHFVRFSLLLLLFVDIKRSTSSKC